MSDVNEGGNAKGKDKKIREQKRREETRRDEVAETHFLSGYRL
jgi:hypothetical protein